MSARAAAAVSLALLAAALPRAASAAAEEGVIAALNQNQVSITATFSGSEIFIFGSVKREAPANPAPLDVIVAISGPTERVVVRRKARVFGIWANRDAVEIDSAPSFYAIASTRPLSESLSQTADLRHHISIDRQLRLVDAPAAAADARDDYLSALIRVRRASGLYFETEKPVRMMQNTLFATDVLLPANLVEGDYSARVFLLRERRVIDSFETSIKVRKIGLERWVYNLSQDLPAVYGILSIVVALLAGWGASEAFRLLRR